MSESEASQISPWFERRFDFTFPVELLPNLLARLRGTPARLEEVVRGRARELLIAKAEGKWSTQEQVGHLLALEDLWFARLEDFVAAREQLTPADLTNRKTDEADFNAQPLERVLAEFRSAREALLTRISELDVSSFSRAVPHPRLKTPMRLIDHLFFIAEHDDHHLARIWELLHSAG